MQYTPWSDCYHPMMTVGQSFELVGAMLLWLIVLLGIVAYRFNNDDRQIVFAVKLVVVAFWVWGTWIPAAVYFLR
jgi:hypothetical protein